MKGGRYLLCGQRERGREMSACTCLLFEKKGFCHLTVITNEKISLLSACKSTAFLNVKILFEFLLVAVY